MVDLLAEVAAGGNQTNTVLSRSNMHPLDILQTNYVARRYGAVRYTGFGRIVLAGASELARLIYNANPLVITYNHGMSLLPLLIDQRHIDLARDIFRAEAQSIQVGRRRLITNAHPDQAARGERASLIESSIIHNAMHSFWMLLPLVLQFERTVDQRNALLTSLLDYSLRLNIASFGPLRQAARQYFQNPSALTLLQRLLSRGFLESAGLFVRQMTATGELNETQIIEQLIPEIQSSMSSENVERLTSLFTSLTADFLSGHRRFQRDLIDNVLGRALGQEPSDERPLREQVSLLLVKHLGPLLTSRQRARAITLAESTGQEEAARALAQQGEEEEEEEEGQAGPSTMPATKKRKL